MIFHSYVSLPGGTCGVYIYNIHIIYIYFTIYSILYIYDIFYVNVYVYNVGMYVIHTLNSVNE